MRPLTTLLILLVTLADVSLASDTPEIDQTREQFVEAFNARNPGIAVDDLVPTNECVCQLPDCSACLFR